MKILVTHPGRIHGPSLLVGLVAIGLFWGIGRTRYAAFASIVGLVTWVIRRRVNGGIEQARERARGPS